MKTWMRRLSFRGLSIQQRLPLLICVLLLTVIITGGLVSYLKVKDDTMDSGRARLISAYSRMDTLLVQSFRNSIAIMRIAASQEPVRKYLLTRDTDLRDSAYGMLSTLQDTTTVLTELLDKDMGIVLSAGTPGIERTVGFHLLEGPRSRPDTGRVGYLYNVGAYLYYPLAMAIVDKKEIAGYLIRWRRLSTSAQAVQRTVKLMGLENFELYLGNNDNSLWTNLLAPMSNPIPSDPEKDEGVLSYVNSQGRPVIALTNRIRLTNWVLLIEESEQAILQPAKEFLQRLILIGAVLLVGGMLWGWLMSRNITRPLNRLTAAASAIAHGNYSTTVPVDRRDELGKLARAFNAMIGQVNKAKDVLEQKVIETEEMNEQLRSLSAHLQNIREQERMHIAREMHDELGQLLTGFKMDVSWINKRMTENSDPQLREKLAAMTGLVDESVKFVRKLAAELRPSILDDLGLVPALEWHSIEFGKRYNIEVAFHSKVTDLKTSPLIATGLFRMYQESLTNVARHSGATRVTATLEVKKDKISFSIADNGKGFDADHTEGKTLGLLGMKERATMIGGQLEINSAPGKGTKVLITVPITAPAKQPVREVGG